MGLFEASQPFLDLFLGLAFFGLSGPGLFWAFCGLGPLLGFSAFSEPWGPRAFCGLFWAFQPFLGLGAFSGPSKLLDSSRASLGPLRASSGLLGLFPAFSEPWGLFGAFSGLGPLVGFFGLLSLFPAFSGPGGLFWWAFSKLLDLFPGLFPAFS